MFLKNQDCMVRGGGTCMGTMVGAMSHHWQMGLVVFGCLLLTPKKSVPMFPVCFRPCCELPSGWNSTLKVELLSELWGRRAPGQCYFRVSVFTWNQTELYFGKSTIQNKAPFQSTQGSFGFVCEDLGSKHTISWSSVACCYQEECDIFR